MARTTKIIGFSVSEELAEEYDSMAKAERKNKSQLFRDMITTYKQSKQLRELGELQDYGAPKARERGIETEKDVIDIIHEARGV